MHETLTQDHRWAAKSKATRFKVVENAIQIGGWTKEPHVKRFRMSTYVFAPKIQAGSDRKNSGTVPGSFPRAWRLRVYRLYRLPHCPQIEHESQSLAKMFR